jgi:hypothetical protein
LRAAVLDSSGAAVPGAECALTNQSTSAVLTVKSDSQGSCTFNIIPAGTYSFAVQAKGFKALSVKDIAVDAGQTRTLGNLSLDVGAIESVLATASFRRSTWRRRRRPTTLHDATAECSQGRDMFARDHDSLESWTTCRRDAKRHRPDSLRGTFINGQPRKFQETTRWTVSRTSTPGRTTPSVQTQHGLHR